MNEALFSGVDVYPCWELNILFAMLLTVQSKETTRLTVIGTRARSVTDSVRRMPKSTYGIGITMYSGLR